MSWITRLTGGFRGLLRRRALAEDLDAELRSFVQEAVDEKVRAGASREAAIHAARLQLGSAAAVHDHVRAAGWESAVDSIGQDLRYAVRSLRKSPGFTAAATVTLALGIGATTAIFSLLDALMFKTLPVQDPEALVLLDGSLQYPVFQAFGRHTDIFADLCATSGVTALEVEIESGVRERAAVSLVSGSYFSTLGVAPVIGRTFDVQDDGGPGAQAIAIASYSYWQRRFGGDRAVQERVVRVSGVPVTIVGVARPGFFGEQVGVAPDLWMPLTLWGQVVPGRNLIESPGTGWLRLIGRIHPGLPASGVQPTLTETFRRVLTEIFGPNPPADTQREIARASITIRPASKGISPLRTQFARPLFLLMGAVALVLLITCANIANLLLARASARRREIDLRLALGLGAGRLVRQLLTESMVLAAMGGAMGLTLAGLGREALLRLISADGSRLPLAVTTDMKLLGFVAGVSSATALLFGLVPAWQAARPAVISSLTARRGGVGRQRLTSLLVVAQVAVSLVLLTGAGLFLRTMANLRGVDLGFEPQRLLVLDLEPQGAGYGGERAVALTRRLLERIEALPGVVSASVSENGLLGGRDLRTNLLRPAGLVSGREGLPHTHWDVVGPRYFSTIAARIVSGRDFTWRDAAGAPHVVAINEEMARKWFAGTDPVGRLLVWGTGAGAQRLEIVAVTQDVKHSGPRDQPQLRVYFPYLQMSSIRPNWILASTRFIVRTSDNPAALAPSLRHAVLSEDPRLSITTIDLGPELVSRTLLRERLIVILLVAFGALAVGLAGLGLYGLIAYQVTQRTSEIGIRMALGARRTDVLRAMLQRALGWIAVGIGLGVPLALAAGRLAQGLLFGLGTADVPTLLGAVLVMCMMGLLAACIPARRASRVDPLVALRCD